MCCASPRFVLTWPRPTTSATPIFGLASADPGKWLPLRSNTAARGGTRNHCIQRRIHNIYFGADADDVVEFNDVARAHANAAVADRQTDITLLRRPVNINVARISERVLWLASP